MANRMFNDVEGLVRETKVLSGSFAPDTANAPTDLRGKGFSVARVSAGLFRITFEAKYVDLVAALAHLQLAAGADQFTQIGAYTAANRTLDIRVWDRSGGAVADVAADANNRVNFRCYFTKGKVGLHV